MKSKLNRFILTQVFILFAVFQLTAQNNVSTGWFPFYNYSHYRLFDSVAYHTTFKWENYIIQPDTNLFSDLFQRKSNNFQASLTPVFNSEVGAGTNTNTFYYKALAGLRFNAAYKNKLQFFFSGHYNLEKMDANQQQFTDSTGVLPHVGVKADPHKSTYNFFNYNVYLVYNATDYFRVITGKTTLFIGEGYRSLWLSDNAPEPFILSGTLHLKNIYYNYNILKSTDIDNSFETEKFSNKYMMLHTAGINITKYVSFGFFENVIAGGLDSLGNNRGMEWSYLNPVIFFRPVEFSLGSPDNVLMGAFLNIKPGWKTMLYSQLILDEFILSNFKAKNGWWGNKYGIQVGFKAFNFLRINGLMVQAEVNRIMPFTYSHQNPVRNNGFMVHPVAHPLGANLQELIGIIRYTRNGLAIELAAFYTKRGIDFDSVSYGGNVYRSYSDRGADYNQYLFQGKQITSVNFSALLHYKPLVTKNIVLTVGGKYFNDNFNSRTLIHTGIGIGITKYKSEFY